MEAAVTKATRPWSVDCMSLSSSIYLVSSGYSAAGLSIQFFAYQHKHFNKTTAP